MGLLMTERTEGECREDSDADYDAEEREVEGEPKYMGHGDMVRCHHMS